MSRIRVSNAPTHMQVEIQGIPVPGVAVQEQFILPGFQAGLFHVLKNLSAQPFPLIRRQQVQRV